MAESETVGATRIPATAASMQPTIHADLALRTLLAPLRTVSLRSSTEARIVTPTRVR